MPIPCTVRISKFLSIVVVAVICLLFLSSCAQNISNGSTTIPAGPIKIGVALSLTGDSSADGQATKLGYDTWEAYVNSHGGLLGHQVQMVYYDDATKLDQTRTLYEKLITVDHVSFVLGPFNDPETVTGAEVARAHNMPFIEGIGTSPSTFQKGLTNLFAVSLSATAYMKSFVNYILSLPADTRPKTVAYATSDDPFTYPQIDTIKPILEAGGLQTALYEKFSAENADPVGPAQKVVAANADVAIIGSAGLQDCLAFLKTFIQQHYNPKLTIFTSGPDQGDQFVQAIGKNNTEGLLVPNDGWWPGVKSYQNADFINLITTRYKMSPGDISSDSVQAFSVGQVLQQAVDKTQSLDNEKLIQVLRTGTFQSLQGPVAFDSTGQNRLAVAFLFQWQKGNLIPVYPQSQAQANLEYPKPTWGATS